MESVHEHIAVAPQQSHLFNTSVKENLQLANPSASIDMIQTACAVALADTFVEKLPEKYDTFVGEQGYKLSGGERQRLAIARAIIADAPISIFDEPTSGLDAMTEEQLLLSVHQTLEGKSMLWITHRLTGLEVMDEIIVMNHGMIEERGTHQELLQKNGLYRKMWDTQQLMIGATEMAV